MPALRTALLALALLLGVGAHTPAQALMRHQVDWFGQALEDDWPGIGDRSIGVAEVGALVARIKKAATFNQGFTQTEYVASALVDMRYHTTDPANIDPDAFEREVLAELKMPSEIVMRHRSTHFGHIFSGEGYSAGYYGYMWADVLTADAAEAFEQAPGGFYDKDLAQKLVENLFTVRNAVDPEVAYRAFRGRDAGIDAVMRSYGFPVPD